MYNVPAPDEDWTRSHGPRWSFAKASPRIAAPPTMPPADRARSHGLGRGDGGASSQRRQAKELAAVRGGQEDVGEGYGAHDAVLKTGGPGQVNSCEGGRRRRGNRLLSAAALADGQGKVEETAAMTSVAGDEAPGCISQATALKRQQDTRASGVKEGKGDFVQTW